MYYNYITAAFQPLSVQPRKLEKITEPVVKAGRSHAGFNPANRSDVKLFEAVLDGNHVVRGFRNVDIREACMERPPIPRDVVAKARRSADC